MRGGILPRDAAAMIGQTFPWAAQQRGTAQLSQDHAVHVGLVLRVIEQIPDELWPAGADRVRLIGAIGAMSAAQQRWAAGGHPGHSVRLDNERAIGGHPIAVAYEILSGLPDEAPTLGEEDLKYIPDNDARRSIRTDMSNAQRALDNREWKGATVLAGSVIEALLLWAVSNRRPDAPEAIARATLADPSLDAKRLQRDAPEEWYITHLIPVARELGEISEATRNACNLAAGYRNLIHPGRVLRTGADASQGTAHLSVGAMREVDRDLAKRHT